LLLRDKGRPACSRQDKTAVPAGNRAGKLAMPAVHPLHAALQPPPLPCGSKVLWRAGWSDRGVAGLACAPGWPGGAGGLPAGLCLRACAVPAGEGQRLSLVFFSYTVCIFLGFIKCIFKTVCLLNFCKFTLTLFDW
jgi:hypothetical protein